MTAVDKSTLSAADPREAGTQRRSAYSRRSGGRLQRGKIGENVVAFLQGLKPHGE
jgi:hypothetical protein